MIDNIGHPCHSSCTYRFGFMSKVHKVTDVVGLIVGAITFLGPLSSDSRQVDMPYLQSRSIELCLRLLKSSIPLCCIAIVAGRIVEEVVTYRQIDIFDTKACELMDIVHPSRSHTNSCANRQHQLFRVSNRALADNVVLGIRLIGISHLANLDIIKQVLRHCRVCRVRLQTDAGFSGNSTEIDTYGVPLSILNLVICRVVDNQLLVEITNRKQRNRLSILGISPICASFGGIDLFTIEIVCQDASRTTLAISINQQRVAGCTIQESHLESYLRHTHLALRKILELREGHDTSFACRMTHSQCAIDLTTLEEHLPSIQTAALEI